MLLAGDYDEEAAQLLLESKVGDLRVSFNHNIHQGDVTVLSQYSVDMHGCQAYRPYNLQNPNEKPERPTFATAKQLKSQKSFKSI